MNNSNNSNITGADLQFLVDSTWNNRIDHQQLDLICMSILMSSHIQQTPLSSGENLLDRAIIIRKLYQSIQDASLFANLFPNEAL